MNQQKVNIRLHITLIFTLLAGVLFCNCGGGGGGGGSSANSNEISPSISAGVNYYETLISAGVGRSVAVDNTVNFYKKQEGILDAYSAADGRNIFIEQINGVTTFFITDITSDVNSLSVKRFNYDKSGNSTSITLASSVNGLKAIILDPFNLPARNPSSIYNILSGFPGAEVKYLKGSDVTPEIFQNLSGNDLIYYFGHGGVDSKNGGVVAIGTGVAYSEDRFKSYLYKYNDLKENNNGRYKYFFHAVALGGNGKKIEYIFINSNFIADYSKALNATAVYIDACQTLDSDKNVTMANAFMNNGASSYLGWSNIEFFYQSNFSWSLTANLAESFFKDIIACKSVSAAFNNLPFDFNFADLHYRGDGILPICNPITPILPGAISVSPSSGSWTSTPQNLSVSSSGATAIYYTMVNTTDGTTPADPREPTSSDNDGPISVSSGAGTYQLYATAGQNKQIKLRLKGYNSAGAGPASVVYSYNINLSGTSPLPTWTKTFGGTGDDGASAVQQTSDGGYIIAGTTYSFGAGYSDVYLIKTDAYGNVVWTKTFGGTGRDYGYSVQQTSDGGYIISGSTESFGVGMFDVYLIKTDASGNSVWTKNYGGTDVDEGHSVQQTSDGGYIITGSTWIVGSFIEPYRYSDVYLIKTDASGNSVWTKNYGGTDVDGGHSVQQTSDGGYIITGTTWSFGSGQSDIYLIKTDASGNNVWTKTFGGTSFDEGYSVQQTTDGGYIIVGRGVTYGENGWYVYLIKTDASGNSVWTKTIRVVGNDYGYSVKQTLDGGYIITGQSSSSVDSSHSGVSLIKTDASGNAVWTKTFGGFYDIGRSVQQTSDGGYIIAGSTSSFGAGGSDVYLIKTDSSGNVGGTPSTVTISVSPASTTLAPGAIQQFAATVTGTTNTSVSWSTQEGSAGGTVTSGGLYTAPSTPGTYHVVATSQAENTKNATAVVTVTTSTTNYTLAVNAANGTVVKNPNQTSYASGTSVQLTATANSGYTFTGWSGDITGTANPVTVTMNSNKTITANFTLSSTMTSWTKTFGGTGLDVAYAVQQTTDGGYIVAGLTTSFGAGASDAYLIKMDASGNILWTKTFGGTFGDELASAVQQTTDGGYIVAGGYSIRQGNRDAYLIKTDANGNTLWTKTFGETNDDLANAVRQTTDGGYIVAGYTTSFGTIGGDAFLIKTDANGNTLWTKTFGGTNGDLAQAVQQTTDGGYIVAGFTKSFGAGNMDAYLIKTDASGNTLWTRTFGGTGDDVAYAVQQTTDGGYIVAGLTNYSDAISGDAFLIKTDANGNTLWTKTFGGTNHDYIYGVQQTTDGGYIVAGLTQSFGAGASDVYLIKTDASGNTLWTKTFGGTNGDYAHAVQQTTDGGYIVAGITYSFGAIGGDVYLIKTDASGNVN